MGICLDRIISAMSIALDLAEMSSTKNTEIIEEITNINYSEHKFLYHSRRTTYISMELSKVLCLDIDIVKKQYVSSMLHDIGAASSLIVSHDADNFISEHCRIGASIISSFPFYSDLSNIILYHHENYNGTGIFKVAGENIPIESQIIRMADLLEVQYDDRTPAYLQKEKLIQWIRANVNIIFSENLVNAFIKIASRDTFWFNLENVVHMDFILTEAAPPLDAYINLQQFEAAAYIFADIIDNVSKFTARHSRAIAELAYKVSKFVGYSEEKCVKMKIAGLLHDIGKLSIPGKILDKAAPLSKEEFSIIKSHAYYTKIILDRIVDIPDISDWASNHHEKLNGKGYPRALTADAIDEESRILGVCDIYTALTEDRPYRDGLDVEKAFSILDNMVEGGLICEKAVSYLKSTINS